MKYSEVILVSSLVVLVGAALSEACSCQAAHPQELFCNSHFVIKALVENRTEDDQSAYFHVEILQILKEPTENSPFVENLIQNETDSHGDTSTESTVTMTTTTETTNSTANVTTTTPLVTTDGGSPMRTVLLTNKDGSMCGVNLNIGETYIIGGRIVGDYLVIGLCGLHMQYKALNKRQIKFFRYKFQVNCDCQINYCRGKRCPPKHGDECEIDPLYRPLECSEQFSMCKRRSDGTCQWTNNKNNDLCRQEYAKRMRLRH